MAWQRHWLIDHAALSEHTAPAQTDCALWFLQTNCPHEQERTELRAVFFRTYPMCPCNGKNHCFTFWCLSWILCLRKLIHPCWLSRCAVITSRQLRKQTWVRVLQPRRNSQKLSFLLRVGEWAYWVDVPKRKQTAMSGQPGVCRVWNVRQVQENPFVTEPLSVKKLSKLQFNKYDRLWSEKRSEKSTDLRSLQGAWSCGRVNDVASSVFTHHWWKGLAKWGKLKDKYWKCLSDVIFGQRNQWRITQVSLPNSLLAIFFFFYTEICPLFCSVGTVNFKTEWVLPSKPQTKFLKGADRPNRFGLIVLGDRIILQNDPFALVDLHFFCSAHAISFCLFFFQCKNYLFELIRFNCKAHTRSFWTIIFAPQVHAKTSCRAAEMFSAGEICSENAACRVLGSESREVVQNIFASCEREHKRDTGGNRFQTKTNWHQANLLPWNRTTHAAGCFSAMARD